MTEPTDPEIDAAARAERIARLKARQVARSTGSPAGASGARRSRSTRRRPSPAASAKVLVAGASSAAVLGLMAGFGIGDRIGAADEAWPLGGGDQALIPTAATLSIEPAPSSPAPPGVIVVVVDEAGRVIATSADLDPAGISVPAAAAGIAPTRVEVPVAIPAPPAAGPAPSPAQATTSGS